MKTTLIYLLILLAIPFSNTFATKKHPEKSGSKYRSAKVAVKASVLDKIEYNFSSSVIRPTYFKKLDQLATVLIQSKSALSLRGYADSIGNYTTNWHLSEKRAIVVKAYLVNKGVDIDHIITTPFGSTKPVASNKTSKGRQMNRRVEVQVSDAE